MFRTTLFSIVLTLAIGQNASLFCEAWCHGGMSAECPHEDATTSPSVSSEGNCNSTDVGAIAFLRKDARRTAAAPDAQNALLVPRFLFAPSPSDLRSGFELGWRLLLEERPLIFALRI